MRQTFPNEKMYYNDEKYNKIQTDLIEREGNTGRQIWAWSRESKKAFEMQSLRKWDWAVQVDKFKMKEKERKGEH